MKSNQIVSRFLERKNQFGVVGLSRKQVSWLFDQLKKEYGIDVFKDRHHNITVYDTDENAYQFAIYPNGGGFIKPFPEVEKQEDTTKAYLDASAKLRADGHELAALEIEKIYGVK